MPKRLQKGLNGYALVTWHRVIYRFPPDSMKSMAVAAGIGSVLKGGKPVNMPEWTALAEEFAAEGFTPLELMLLRESAHGKEWGIARTCPELVTEIPSDHYPVYPVYRFHAPGWRPWLHLVRAGVDPVEAINRVVLES